MFDIREIFRKRTSRLAIFIIIGFITGIAIIEIVLNLWVRSSLMSSLRGKGPDTRIKASMSWLSTKDFLQGKVGWIRIDAWNCQISDLSYSRFQLDNRGFSYNLPLLVKEKRLQIISAEKTLITAVIREDALKEYLNYKHPGYDLAVIIHSDLIKFSGQAIFFGSKVPVLLTGRLKNSTGKTIRFYPLSLSVANHIVSNDLLHLLANQLPLEFSLLENWPLQISGIRLLEGVLQISLKESPLKR